MNGKAWYRAGLFGTVVAVLVSAGCTSTGGYEGDERAAVSGQVTLDGKPLPYGTINFLGQSSGRGASTAIQNGAYSIPEEQGPNAGTYKVSIIGYGKAPAGESESDESADLGPQVVPKKYNAESTLQAEITLGENVHNFELTTD
jgi:hypothetical protein